MTVPRLQVGVDFLLKLDVSEVLEGDWVGLYLADTDNSHHFSIHYEDRWYRVNRERVKNGIPWAGCFGPWQNGTYQFRYFGKDWKTAGALYTTDPFEVTGEPVLPTPMSVSAARAAAPVSSLKAMTFNILISGSRVEDGVQSIIKILLHHQPDVLGLQECNELTVRKIVEGLGSTYNFTYSSRVNGAIVSKFPIVDRLESDHLLFHSATVQLPGQAGHRIRVLNSHLSPYPYGPYEIRDGSTVAKVERMCSELQGKQTRDAISEMVVGECLPIILLGDHNIPSHLDHTKSMVENEVYNTYRSAKPCLPSQIKWPVSLSLYDVGFTDSFRDVHPTPFVECATDSKEDVFNPCPNKSGTSEFRTIGDFSYNCLPSTSKPNEVHDRIDFVYLRSASSSNNVRVSGDGDTCDEANLNSTPDPPALRLTPREAFMVRTVPHSTAAYPSDHCAVLIEYECSAL